MIIEYSEADDSRVRWNSGGEWKSDDIEELIAAYEWKQSIPRHGDLIDRDVLLSKVQKWYWEALETVKRMPTVIPAERREE